MEPEAPEWKRRPRLTSTGWTTLTLVLLALFGATVALVLFDRDSGEPTARGAANGSEILQMREVLEVIPSGSPEWNSVTVTCFARGNASPSPCLDPLAAAEWSVVLLAADGNEKFALGALVDLEGRCGTGFGGASSRDGRMADRDRAHTERIGTILGHHQRDSSANSWPSW